MKFKRIVAVAWNEFNLWKLFFCINITIVSLLFSITLLVISLAICLPGEIYKEVKDTDLCYFSIGNIDPTDLDYLLKLPITIQSYGVDCYLEDYMQGFNKNQKKNIMEEALFFNFEQYREGYNSETLQEINDHLVDGERWQKADNERITIMPMWIEESVAEALDLSVSEHLTLKNDFGQVDFFIKGIYEKQMELANAYIPICLYSEVFMEDKTHNLELSVKCDSSIEDLLGIIGGLKEKYFIVDSYENSIQSMLYFLYMLYVLVGILNCMSLQILNNLNKLYYMHRMEFWKINKSIGMTDIDIIKINSVLVEIVLGISLLFGATLAYFLNQYFVSYIKALFEMEELNCKLSGRSVLGLYFVCNLLFLLGKWMKKVNRK